MSKRNGKKNEVGKRTGPALHEADETAEAELHHAPVALRLRVLLGLERRDAAYRQRRPDPLRE